MRNEMLDAVFIFNDIEEMTTLRVPADKIEQRNGWILALWNDEIISGVKAEYLKAFYLDGGCEVVV